MQRRSAFAASLIAALAAAGPGCSIFYSRPVQEMSDTAASLRAAREVQADTLAPELYRQANEWFFRAKNEYKFKNFKLANEYAAKARYFAEQAEFESLRSGGTRTAADEANIPDPMANTLPGAPAGGAQGPPEKKPAPYEYPTPQATPYEPPGAAKPP